MITFGYGLDAWFVVIVSNDLEAGHTHVLLAGSWRQCIWSIGSAIVNVFGSCVGASG